MVPIWGLWYKTNMGPIWAMYINPILFPHITHLGPIQYHDPDGMWAQDGLYGINVGILSHGPDIAHVTLIPDCSHITHLGPIRYHNLAAHGPTMGYMGLMWESCPIAQV